MSIEPTMGPGASSINPFSIFADVLEQSAAGVASGQEFVKHGYENVLRAAARLRQRVGAGTSYEAGDAVHDLFLLAGEAGVSCSHDPRRGTLANLRDGLLRNLIRRDLRSGFRRKRRELAFEPADPAPGPADAVEWSELEEARQRIREAVAGLPQAQRREIERRVPGLATAAAGGAMPPDDEVRPNYVRRTRLWQAAVKRLKATLADLDGLVI